VVICLEQGANLHMAQLMPLPLILASVKRAVERVCVFRLIHCSDILGKDKKHRRNHDHNTTKGMNNRYHR